MDTFKKQSPQVKALLITLTAIFFSEIVAMVVIYFLDLESYVLSTLVDASIMVIMILPVLFYLLLNPLLLEVSERKRVEAQLRLQTKALESAANGIIITDKQGTVIWANEAIKDVTGFELDEIIGKPSNLLKSGQHSDEFYKSLWSTILSGQVWHGEITNRKKNGSLYVEEQTITPVLNDEQQISYFIAIKQDVTEQKFASEQLEQVNRELLTISELEHKQRILAEGLIDSMAALNSSLELDSVLDRIMEQAQRVIPAMAVATILIRGRYGTIARQLGNKSYPKATGSLSDTFSLDYFPIWKRVVESKEAVVIFDTNQDERWRAVKGSDWIRSALFAPLVAENEVIGIINFNSDKHGTFKEETTHLSRAFATSAAVAIRNARFYTAEQQARQIAETLSAASAALTQNLEFEAVLNVLLDYLQTAVPFDAAFVILPEEEAQYSVRTIRDSDNLRISRETVEKLIKTNMEASIQAQIDEKRLVFVPDFRHNTHWQLPEGFEHLRSLLSLPLEATEKVIGLVVLVKTKVDSITEYNINLAQAIVRQAAVAMQNAWLFEQVRAGREHLQMLSKRLIDVQENERREIARELHDETSQSLTSMKLGLLLIEKDAEHPKRVATHVSRLRQTTDEVMESLHRLAMNLRPASLDHLGLIETLKNLIVSLGEQAGLDAKFRTLGINGELHLSETVETALYRIVQEALTNVIRHADASRVDVILEYRNKNLKIVIEDDGKGISTKELSTGDHLGLLGMQERTSQLGGQMQIDSTKGVGTTLVVEVPVDD
jgi:PAS domain S-box-containing protein